MSKKFVVATMSTLGMITESVEQAMDRHLTYWFMAKRSQGSSITNTSSFDWVLMHSQGNKDKVVEDVAEYLKAHFEELFDVVEVQAKTTDMDVEGDGKFILTIQLTVVHDNKRYDLGNSVVVSGKSFEILNRGRVDARQ